WRSFDQAVKGAGKAAPEDFRVRRDSAGYQAAKGKKDLGADVDLVGPGPAYERWKKTPAYQEWLKETGQPRAEAPGPEPLAPGEVRHFVGHTAGVGSLALTKDGSKLLSGSNDKTLRLWDVATGQEIRRFVGHTDFVFRVALSPDGRRAVSTADYR